MNINKWIDKNTTRLDKKTVVISGSTGGLGRELCFYLASLGADLVLLDRNMKKSSELECALKAKFPLLSVKRVCADMSDMSSVRAAADELALMEIDYLILNAGAYSIPRCTVDTGYDNVYQINFISPYYLARRLLPSISDRGGRVVAVGSIAHNYSRINENDIDFSKVKKDSLVYGNAKRFLTYSLLSLNSDNIVVTHPGISFTGITNHYPKLIFALIKHPMKIIFMHPRVACLSILRGLFAPVIPFTWIGPCAFDVWGRPSCKKLCTAKNGEIKRIAEIAGEIYNKTNINE